MKIHNLRRRDRTIFTHHAPGLLLCVLSLIIAAGTAHAVVTIRCPTNITVWTCGTNQTVQYPPPVATTDCRLGLDAIICEPPSGSVFGVGTNTVVCQARDNCEDLDRCTFTITVLRDTNAPSIRCPTNITVWSCSSNGVVVNYPPPVAADDTDPNPTVICQPVSGSIFRNGNTEVLCEAIDNCGNRARCTFTVTVVQDIRPPKIDCPRDIVWCETNGMIVTYTATAVDNADPNPTIVCDPPSGSSFPLGTTVVECRAADNCGNESRCRFTVTIVPDQKPVLNVTKEGDYLLICWRKVCGCYRLQGTRSLNPPITWADVADTPEDLGSGYCLRYPIDRGMRYFRLIECDRPRAHIYNVLASGIADADARRLARALNIPAEDVLLQDGVCFFLDPKKFQAIPVQEITDMEIRTELTQGTEDQRDLAFNGLDLEGLRGLRVLPKETAIALFERGLREADLLPDGEPKATHTLFDAVDMEGQPIADETPIDTHVIFHFDLQGIPLTGPGAKVSMAFGSDGSPTALHFAMRKLEPGMDVPIIPIEEAMRRCERLYPRLRPQGQPRLIYFSPSLSLPAVQKLVPCFECGGAAPDGDERAQVLRAIIPATDDPAFVPTVDLDVVVEGNRVSARALVQGGTPPYSYEWMSSNVDLGDVLPTASSVQYTADDPRGGTLERIRVVVTDANGVPAHAEEIVMVESTGPTVAPALMAGIAGTMAIVGVEDFGIERAVSDMGSAQQSGFKNRFLSEGVDKRFNFTGLSCWERDFREGGDGLDASYVDNADIVFYIGHGNGSGFNFESEQNDGKVHYLDVPGDWGDKDIEWLALLSCEVLKDTHNGLKWNQRWGPAFDGLHLLLGFQTVANDWSGFGGAFADWTLGAFNVLPPMPIAQSWFLAKAQHQPAERVAVVMGPIGPGDCINYLDYFVGKGPVGPDFRGSQIKGFWRVRFQ